MNDEGRKKSPRKSHAEFLPSWFLREQRERKKESKKEINWYKLIKKYV